MIPVTEGRNGHGHSDNEGIYDLYVYYHDDLYGTAFYFFPEPSDGTAETILQRHLFQPHEANIGIDPHAQRGAGTDQCP